MNTGNRDLGPVESGYDGSDQIAQLLSSVDPRPPLPDERRDRVRDAVHGHWRTRVRRRRRRQMYVLSGSLAAILALAVLLTPAVRNRLTSFFEPPFEGAVAEVERVRGLVWQASPDTPEQYPGSRLTEEAILEAGTRIETTAEARLALQLLDGRSVRLDNRTRLRFTSPLTIVLESGAVYVDSSLEAGLGDPVEIQTTLGRVLEIGTQFEVRVTDQALRVRVREGAVHLNRDGEAIAAEAGIELSVGGDGQVSRRSVDIHGPIWDWVQEIAPAFALEGSSLPSFLSWVSRETGRVVRFTDANTSRSSAEIIVHGSIEGMRPDAALEAVLPTCGLTHRIDADSWILEARSQ